MTQQTYRIGIYRVQSETDNNYLKSRLAKLDLGKIVSVYRKNNDAYVTFKTINTANMLWKKLTDGEVFHIVHDKLTQNFWSMRYLKPLEK